MFREREPLIQSNSSSSTLMGGKLRHLLDRLNWRFIPGAILMISLLIVGAVVVLSRDEGELVAQEPVPGDPLVPPLLPPKQDIDPPAPKRLQLSPIPPASPVRPILKSRAPHNRSPFSPNPWDPVKLTAPDTYESEGCENGLMYFEGFGPLVNKGGIKSLKIRDLIIDAPNFSQQLQGFSSLESIVMENVWVSGDFSRVPLPALKKFIYHQFHNDKTDVYKSPAKLKSLLFFDKGPGQSWDLESDLLTLNVTIQVKIAGTKLLQIEPEFGDIFINTHYCEDILKHYTGAFTLSTLSLNWCAVTNKSVESFPSTLQTLQFNNAVPGNADLSRIVERVSNIKELHISQRFHCDWPGYEIFLNVSQLGESVETLSVGNVDISFSGPSPIKNLSIDNYITPGLSKQFDQVFPQVRSLALFNVSAADAYPVLEKVLATGGLAEWVLVTNLTRVQTPQMTATETSVESCLGKAGVPHGATCFLLELNTTNGTFVGRSISTFERNYYRYTRLAFDQIDTYEDYVNWDAFPK